MPRLPRISAKDAIRVFESVGYEVVRQRGSHIRLRDASGHISVDRSSATVEERLDARAADVVAALNAGGA